MDPLSIAGLGMGLISGVGKLFGSRKANRQLDRLLASNPAYKANPLAAQQLGLAQTLLNARAPGAAAAERNIYQTQANTQANVNRNATDASQALAMAAAGQGQANMAIGNLAIQEAQDYQRRYGNLTAAQQGVINEQDKVFQDQVRRWQDEASIRGAQNMNRQSNWSSLGNLGFGMMNLGMAGGWNAMFPGGNNAGNTSDPGGSLQGRPLNMPLQPYGPAPSPANNIPLPPYGQPPAPTSIPIQPYRPYKF